jgi:hypothetical protein
MRTRGYRVLRRRAAFDRDARGIYSLRYGKITRNGSKGIFQFALSQRRGIAVPHIFFTCPSCGVINKDYLSIEGIGYRMDKGWGDRGMIRSCHNCGACGVPIPYTLRMSFSRLKEKYYALLKETRKGDTL